MGQRDGQTDGRIALFQDAAVPREHNNADRRPVLTCFADDRLENTARDVVGCSQVFLVRRRTHPPTRTHARTRRRGVLASGVRRVNEVNPRRTRLVLGRVTVFGRVCHLGV